MKRTGLFTKIFIYTFSIFSVLVICLISYLFSLSLDLSESPSRNHWSEGTAIAQSLEGKNRQSIEQVLELSFPDQ